MTVHVRLLPPCARPTVRTAPPLASSASSRSVRQPRPWTSSLNASVSVNASPPWLAGAPSNAAVSGVSSSAIVPVALARASVAPAGADSASVSVSASSVSASSSRATVTVFCVSPAANVSVPEAAL